ncbi:response regulator [Maribacter algarum]|uniref:Response regulator n=1 Tax=Maribacter algarum (ex Zhang et al. 2020) TaxID=2578118 RepID=A0A5S3PE88_9FLAO|nr:response regulator [Maribacter algarum]TMM52197.1 response regulator [Maribacter algarum]
MKLNVIVIDDSGVQLALSSKLIEKNEHLNLVGTFTNPFLGLSAVNSEDIDLVLLDVEMPEIDGFSLQKLFKDSVEVIVNSTRSSFEIEAYSNGAIDFMAKPLCASRLDLAVSRVLELKNLLTFEKTISTVAS